MVLSALSSCLHDRAPPQQVSLLKLGESVERGDKEASAVAIEGTTRTGSQVSW